jgi:hypothetical protein
MNEELTLAKKLGSRQTIGIGCDLKDVQNASDGIVRGSGRLEHANFAVLILDYEVGECPASVGSKAHLMYSRFFALLVSTLGFRLRTFEVSNLDVFGPL